MTYTTHFTLTLLFILLNIGTIISQSNTWSSKKILHYFDYLEACSSNVIYGSSGTSNFSINANAQHLAEGVGSLQIDYSFDDSSDEAHIDFPFYGYVKDFSFGNDKAFGFRLWIKNTASNTDKLRIILFEDHNFNYDLYHPDNDIFEYYDTDVLNNMEEGYIDIPFNAFVDFSSNGDGMLDLNRIGHIRIQIKSDSNTPHTNRVYLDEFAWAIDHLPPTSGTGTFEGTFLPLHVYNAESTELNRTIPEWQSEIEQMQCLGMEFLIIQFSQLFRYTGNTGHSYYWPTSSPGMNVSNNNLSTSPIDSIMAAAELQGFEIYLGLNFSHDWYDNVAQRTTPVYYNTMYTRQQVVIQELSDRYTNSPAFKGYYIPQEFYNAWFTAPASTMLANHFKDVAAYCKLVEPNRPVLIAPFFVNGVPKDKLTEWYDNFFSIVNANAILIDKMYVQDAIGQNLNATGFEVSKFFAGIKMAANQHNVDFGVTIETFLQESNCPLDSLNNVPDFDPQWTFRNFTHHDTIFYGVGHQIWEAEQITPNLINFSWYDFTNNSPLKQSYRTYLNTLNPSSTVCTEVSIKVLLQGPYRSTDGNMQSLLNNTQLLPTSQAGYTLSNSLLNTTGDDAIVDWVTVELRSSSDATTILATRPALLQANGHIVDMDGSKTIRFLGLDVSTAYVVVRHRNHLGVMTALPVVLE